LFEEQAYFFIRIELNDVLCDNKINFSSKLAQTMKKIILSLATSFLAISGFSQITITASDMPVSGDTLRYSTASPIGSGFSKGDSGTAKVWDFSALTPLSQSIDTYKTASAVNITYALTISPTAYGYKVADSFPGLGAVLPIKINNLYTFFNKKTGPSRYIAEGFAAVIGGIPTPVNYSDEDEWYYFPLTYLNTNNSTFSLNFSLLTLGSLKISGSRYTRVDGWGTIKTPYLTTATNCIRVRSIVDEVDSVIVATTKVGLPRKTVEYRFLVNGEHYPALWVTASLLGTTETITSIRYRDTKRVTTAISNANASLRAIKTYPNPVRSGVLNIEVPNDWTNYQIALYDIQGKLLLSATNTNTIDMHPFANGKYVLQMLNGAETGYAIIEN